MSEENKQLAKKLTAAKREAKNNAKTNVELRKETRLDFVGTDPSAPKADKPKKVPNVASMPPRRKKKFRSISENNPWN